MSLEVESLRRELLDRFQRLEEGLLAELRRERDVRADLRIELDRMKSERDEARRDLVRAAQALERVGG